LHGNAQVANTSSIVINPFIPDQLEPLPDPAKAILENKLTQLILKSGIVNNDGFQRFIISPKITIVSKEVTSSAPAMTMLSLNVTYYIGDGIEGKVFSTHSTSIMGVESNETKAYIAAFKLINVEDPSLKTFVDKGKQSIMNYYTSQCETLLKRANLLESQMLFDEAIYTLTGIPEECTQCYEKSVPLMVSLIQKRIDWDCKNRVQEASLLWNANQDLETAQACGSILSGIYPNANCFAEAKQLSDKIGKRVLELQDREWDFIYQKEIDLEKDKIKALRDVGVEYGKHQPQNVVYKTLW